MILSDKDIVESIKSGALVIKPFNKNFLGPCSYDVTLGDEFIIYKDEVYDITKPLNYERIKVKNSLLVCPLNYKYDKDKLKEKYGVDVVVEGGVLGTTNEYIELPNNICAQYQGRSSLGRVFLTSHQTAGWIDAGFRGKITLEIVAFDKPVILYVGQRIGQLIFSYLNTPAEVGYCDRKSSKYKNQSSVFPSLIHKEFKE